LSEKIEDRKSKIGFAVDMLREIIPALALLHNFGYSHGDLKPENICARTSNLCDRLKFTLIDFGMSQKLPNRCLIKNKNG